MANATVKKSSETASRACFRSSKRPLNYDSVSSVFSKQSWVSKMKFRFREEMAPRVRAAALEGEEVETTHRVIVMGQIKDLEETETSLEGRTIRKRRTK